jgi:Capsule polysaccharide biosynthesis protein
LRQAMDRLSDAGRAAIVAEARAQLEERLAGSLNQVDVALAYKDKRVYGEKELRQRLGITDGRPLVFIFAHAFIDSPHISSRQIHNDYHHWLTETLAAVAHLSQCHWIVKPHPSAALYGEQGQVEAMVAACGAENVWTAPADLSPLTVVAAARCIVTVQGTVALEYACKGVPAIATGQAFYSGFGFTEQPTTVQSYAQLLADAHRLAPLPPHAVERALLVYGLWNRLAGYQSDLIDQSVLRKVWGYEGARSLNEAYALVNERLSTRTFHELDVVRFLEDADI